MTNREAIEQLKFDMKMILFSSNTTVELTDEDVALENIRLQNSDNYKSYLADELAIAALEKLEAKRPGNIIKSELKTSDESNGYYGDCPACGCHLDSLWTDKKFCSNCGQTLKWEVEQ